MRRHAVALVVLALAASTAQGASARPTCPTLLDDAGDTGALGYPIADDAADLTQVDISTQNRVLTATLTVSGQPVNDDPGIWRQYDVSFGTSEGDWVLRGTLGNGENRFELVSHEQVVDGGLGASVEHWQPTKSLQGRVGRHTVTISAPLARDLPLLGRRVDVYGRTWLATANSISAGGMRTPDGVAMGIDVTEVRSYRVGDRGCR
jgi:hypothetical protein